MTSSLDESSDYEDVVDLTEHIAAGYSHTPATAMYSNVPTVLHIPSFAKIEKSHPEYYSGGGDVLCGAVGDSGVGIAQTANSSHPIQQDCCFISQNSQGNTGGELSVVELYEQGGRNERSDEQTRTNDKIPIFEMQEQDRIYYEEAAKSNDYTPKTEEEHAGINGTDNTAIDELDNILMTSEVLTAISPTAASLSDTKLNQTVNFSKSMNENAEQIVSSSTLEEQGATDTKEQRLLQNEDSGMIASSPLIQIASASNAISDTLLKPNLSDTVMHESHTISDESSTSTEMAPISSRISTRSVAELSDSDDNDFNIFSSSADSAAKRKQMVTRSNPKWTQKARLAIITAPPPKRRSTVISRPNYASHPSLSTSNSQKISKTKFSRPNIALLPVSDRNAPESSDDDIQITKTIDLRESFPIEITRTIDTPLEDVRHITTTTIRRQQPLETTDSSMFRRTFLLTVDLILMHQNITNNNIPVPQAPVLPIAPPEPAMQPAMLKCAVCLELAGTGTKLAATKCGHIFCETCLVDALKSAAKCPICRKPVPKKNGWNRLFL